MLHISKNTLDRGRWVVVDGDGGNLIFLQEKIFPSYRNVTIPHKGWDYFGGNIEKKINLKNVIFPKIFLLRGMWKTFPSSKCLQSVFGFWKRENEFLTSLGYI